MDFGNGPVNTLNLAIPPGGAARLETTGSSPTLNEGFVRMVFDSPVQVTAEFRNWVNGALSSAASVNGTTPAFEYWYFADAYTGIALANQNNFAITCGGTFGDTNGAAVASTPAIQLGPLNHTAFTLGGELSLPSGSVGSFLIICADSSGNPASFVSLGIAGTSGGITSSLPDSSTSAPIRHGEDIEKAFYYLTKIIQTSSDFSVFAPLFGQLQLAIGTDSTTINACAESPQSLPPCSGPVGTVKIWLSLAEELADSPSELAFIIGHELGHVAQLNFGGQGSYQMIFTSSAYNQNIETDADFFGVLCLIAGGYDPYAAAGALGKLTALASNPAFDTAYEANVQSALGMDMHTSLLARLNNLLNTLQGACVADPNACQNYKSIFHPNFPPWVPLSRSGSSSGGQK